MLRIKTGCTREYHENTTKENEIFNESNEIEKLLHVENCNTVIRSEKLLSKLRLQGRL